MSDNATKPPASESPRPPHLTTAQAAEVLQLRPQTLAVWRCARRGPPYRKYGRAIRYFERDLLDWAESQAVTPGEES